MPKEQKVTPRGRHEAGSEGRVKWMDWTFESSKLQPADENAVKVHLKKILQEHQAAGNSPPGYRELRWGMIEGYKQKGYRLTHKQFAKAYAAAPEGLKNPPGRPSCKPP
jgi:hypothetical protein